MDRTALARKRREDAAQPARPRIRMPRNKPGERQDVGYHAHGRSWTSKDSAEVVRLPNAGDAGTGGSMSGSHNEEDAGARHFHVGNVAGGTLFLKPSRMPSAYFARRPPTLLDKPRGPQVNRQETPSARQSDISGTTTSQQRPGLGKPSRPSVSVPPPSMSNVPRHRQTRSHSFSTASDHVRSPTFDSNDFNVLLKEDQELQRPKSATDMPGGYLDLRIPHYRLGTPRFSGTRAYLHNSMYTTTTDDGMRSSVFSRAEYDKLFPAPPGQTRRVTPASYISHEPSVSPNLRNQNQYSTTPSRTASSSPGTLQEDKLRPSMYDRIEANPNSPSIVRYASTNGRILAATTGRLISQITSPQFLDYELLSDFFLTYRAFLSPLELFEYLLARMKWALANSNDVGRIVRVRTFVALRHWILNYFSDDFALDWNVRERVCIGINGLCNSLRQRHDRGGSDINIIGELKKCWRRTCATFWPSNDAMEASPDADIFPGGPDNPDFTESTLDFRGASRRVSQGGSPQTVRRRRVQWAPEEAQQQQAEDAVDDHRQDPRHESIAVSMRTASIPTSPLSAQSLQVLSCSIPFLRHPYSKTGPRNVKDQETNSIQVRASTPSQGKPDGPSTQHKRSGSFSDALRDERAPLPSTAKADNPDVQSLATMTFSGGLLRGLLLEPSPPTVNTLVPISPSIEAKSASHPNVNEIGAQNHPSQQHLGVKRIVGDVRRALSSRKGGAECAANSQRSGNSSDSGIYGPAEMQPTASSWQQARGPPRLDVLGSLIEQSYKAAYANVLLPEPSSPLGQQDTHAQDQPDFDQLQDGRFSRPPKISRLDSHLTTGSRSIVIVDGTKPPEIPIGLGHSRIPSVSSWSNGVKSMPPIPAAGFEGTRAMPLRGAGSTYTDVPQGTQSRDFYPPRFLENLGSDYLTAAYSWRDEGDAQQTPISQARKSSSAQPAGFELPPHGHQLRRRPAGDLKAYDHVHELEPIQRPNTDRSSLTASRSYSHSGVYSSELSGTHFTRGLASKLSHRPGPSKHGDSVELLEPRASQPHMRPSFESEANRLAELDRSLDGGIEDALSKLEGTYARTSRSATDLLNRTAEAARSATEPKTTVEQPEEDQHRPPELPSRGTETMGASIYRLSESDGFSMDTKEPSLAASNAPLVASSAQDTDAPPLPNRSLKTALQVQEGTTTHDTKGVAFTKETHDSRQPTEKNSQAKPESVARASTPHGSFLLDDNESLSDISTDIGDPPDEGLGVRSFFFDDTVPDEPAAGSRSHAHLTPQSNMGASFQHLPGISNRDEVSEARPGSALRDALNTPNILTSTRKKQDDMLPTPELKRAETSALDDVSAHLPFVLAFETDVIAEQLTIIEKDALDEIAWQDLIGLRWQQKAPKASNWIEYLESEEPSGIDIVIARFNLVVKWVVSECVLTQAINERVGCIVKFIHIAAHCHRLRNYASTYQIVLALVSSDLSRLTKTWVKVPQAEKQMLSKLESLCQPLRNFHNLRAEMESDATDQGCIPFIGLYTHDLVYNAQKPAQIDASPPGGEPLVNFERYQMAATIVKSLLRMLEASSKYVLHAHPEALSRCLWLAALDDKSITEMSKKLEQ